MLTVAMVAAVGGCEVVNLFGKGVVGGTGQTVGSAIANFLLGLVGLQG
jgi:hypothetical protein